jgi:hypothetical protein
VDLPGSAALWPDDYDLERFGFGIPPLEKAPLYQRAFEIAILEVAQPADFVLVQSSSNDLVMVEGYEYYTRLL